MYFIRKCTSLFKLEGKLLASQRQLSVFTHREQRTKLIISSVVFTFGSSISCTFEGHLCNLFQRKKKGRKPSPFVIDLHRARTRARATCRVHATSCTRSNILHTNSYELCVLQVVRSTLSLITSCFLVFLSALPSYSPFPFTGLQVLSVFLTWETLRTTISRDKKFNSCNSELPQVVLFVGVALFKVNSEFREKSQNCQM